MTLQGLEEARQLACNIKKEKENHRDQVQMLNNCKNLMLDYSKIQIEAGANRCTVNLQEFHKFLDLQASKSKNELTMLESKFKSM